MKKLLSVLTLGFALVLGLGLRNIQAEDIALIEVYPYDNIECSLETELCRDTKVGRSNWTLTYNGYRYHFVRGAIRYGHQIVDGDSNGLINGAELVAPQYNAFGMFWINNTEAPMVFSDGDRVNLTAVQHRMYAYFDEAGVLQMFENHISQYHIIDDNHGVEEADPDWRLATEIEIDAYNAAPAEEKPADMDYIHVRLKKVTTDVDEDGYLLEPLGYLSWRLKGYSADVEGSKKSLFLDYDPNQVHLPSGWSVMTFGTHDRGAYEPALNMVLDMPYTFLREMDPAIIAYNEVPATLNGLATLDKNPYVDGIQMVADFGEVFAPDFSGVSATWVDMFDGEGEIINLVNQRLPFDFIISQNGVELETINFTVDGANYVASGPITVVDTGIFENQYDFVLKAETPEGQVREAEGIIVVGVLPNRFEGVRNQFHNDGEFINLLDGVTAFNGNGENITRESFDDEGRIKSSGLIATYDKAIFNPYNPQPGTYTITLSVDYTYYYELDPIFAEWFNIADPEAPVSEGALEIRYPDRYNVAFYREAYGGQLTYIDYEHKALVSEMTGAGWGTVVGVVNAEGIMIRTWNGFTAYTETWIEDGVTKSTAHADGGAMQTSIRAYDMQEGEYMLFAHGGAEGTQIRNGFGKKVEMTGRPPFSYTSEASVTYTLTVDDKTAPQAQIVKDPYRIDNTMFDSVEEAILGNIVAFDNYSKVYYIIEDEGGLDLNVPGVYTVKVIVEDEAANYVEVSFDIEVIQARLSETEVANLLEQQKEALEAIIDAQKDILDEQIAIIEGLIEDLANLEDTVVEVLPGETDEKVQEAKDAAAAAASAAAAAQKEAEDNHAEALEKIADLEAKPDKAGTPVWLTIVLVLVGAGASFGAAFLVLGKK